MTHRFRMKLNTALLLPILISACSGEGADLARPPCVNSGGMTCVLPVSYLFAVDATKLGPWVVVTSGYLRPIPARARGDVRYALFPSKEMALHARPEYGIELLIDDLEGLEGFPTQDGVFVQVEGRFDSEKSDPSFWASMRLTRVPREDGEFPFGSVEPGVPHVPSPPPSPPTD